MLYGICWSNFSLAVETLGYTSTLARWDPRCHWFLIWYCALFLLLKCHLKSFSAWQRPCCCWICPLYRIALRWLNQIACTSMTYWHVVLIVRRLNFAALTSDDPRGVWIRLALVHLIRFIWIWRAPMLSSLLLVDVYRWSCIRITFLWMWRKDRLDILEEVLLSLRGHYGCMKLGSSRCRGLRRIGRHSWLHSFY